MKLVIDECIGYQVFLWLIEQKYDAIAIVQNHSGVDDDVVLSMALQENRILITADKGFGAKVFLQQKRHCGVILLRLVDNCVTNQILILKEVLNNYSQDIPNNFIVATEKTVRVIKKK